MKHFLYPAAVSSALLVFSLGCSSMHQTAAVPEPVAPPPKISASPIISDSITANKRYEAEVDVLKQIISDLKEATSARTEGYYGLAETKLEDACILGKEVDISLIQDGELSSQFRETLASLAQENGRNLYESSVIADEDPTAWLEDVDIEQFRAGQWSDDELEKIVNKIALKCNVPIEFNQKVRNAIYYFQNGSRKEFGVWFQRMGKWQPMLEQMLVEEGIPSDMVYLAMIESGFNPKAYSRARAAGMWQFIYTTGKIYGLNRNQWVDERYDPVKSTKAAARYLNDIYKITDDWNNVMAGYNSGEGRVERQLEENPNLEYWDMNLPSETRSYVPFFMAAVIISKAPEVFGFDHIEKESPFEFDTYDVRPGTKLSDAAKCCNIDTAELKSLNPELLSDRVPPDKTYTLRIPKNSKDLFAVEYAKIPAETKASKETAQAPTNLSNVSVKKGDTFSIIASRYHVTTSSLRQANPQITNIDHLAVGQKINLPGSASAASAVASAASSTAKTVSASTAADVDRTHVTTYTVQKNDTIGTIAQKYKTSYKVIQALNNMGSSTQIHLGDRLTVPDTAVQTNATASAQTSSQTQKAASSSSTPTKVHVVQKNETLETIANQYGTTIKTIQNLNKMGSDTKIMSGQKLTVPAATEVASSMLSKTSTGSGNIMHIVQKNDTIFDIAQEYGVNYQSIIDYNKIADFRKIKPGDRLMIPKKD